MAFTPTPTLELPGIDQFSPAQLLRTARLFAANPALPTIVDPAEETPRWFLLDSTSDLEVWLLHWPARTDNGWHDHGDSASAFQVVSGTLLEQTSRNQRREFRTLLAGEGRSLGQGDIHQLANLRLGTALSVHAYAPRITSTTRYAITPTGLQSIAVGTEAQTGDHRPGTEAPSSADGEPVDAHGKPHGTEEAIDVS